MARLASLDVLLVRHAEAAPVEAETPTDDRPLSGAGSQAAAELADELEPYTLTAVYSSPFRRAVDTVGPTAARRGLEVQVIADLRERLLLPESNAEWRGILERAWADADFAPPGSETGRGAQRRAVAVLDLLRSRHPDGGRLLIGSHGNLISLILQALEPAVDYAFHMAMPTPAIYHLNHDGIGWRVMGGYGFRQLADDS